MNVQATYTERMKRAVAGMAANMREYDGITRNCETSAGIGFGLAVGRGADKERGCVLGGTLPTFLGVSTRDVTLETTVATDEYQLDKNVGIQTHGDVWVQVTGNPDPSDPVHYDGTTGIFAASGGIGPVVGARWGSETQSNGICLLHLPAFNQASS